MHTIRNTYGRLSRIICLLFALHILNLSIDSRDREPDFTPEDLSVNDIESFAEFMAEVVFGFNNTFREYDEQDEGDGTIHAFDKVFHASSLPYESTLTRPVIGLRYFVRDADSIPTPAGEITAPPPKG